MYSGERSTFFAAICMLASLVGTAVVVMVASPQLAPLVAFVPSVIAAAVLGRASRAWPSAPIVGLAAAFGGVVPVAFWVLYHLGDANGLQVIIATMTWVSGFTFASFVLAASSAWLVRRLV